MSETKVDKLRAFLARGEWNPLLLRDAIIESTLSSACKLTLDAIVSHHSDASPRPIVGVRRLAHLSSTKRDTVVASVARLEAMGLVGVTRGARTTNVYDLSCTMRGLLSVPPFRTDVVAEPVPNGGTAVPIQGTDSGLSQMGDLSQMGEPDCPNREHSLSQMGERKQPLKLPEMQPDSGAPSEPPPERGHTRGWRKVPKTWQPTAEARQLAQGLGVDFEDQLARFRDHTFKTSMLDADGTFRNWLRKAAEWTRERAVRKSSGSSAQMGLAKPVKVGTLDG